MTANGQQMTELDTFLPQDGSNMKDGLQKGKYKVAVSPAKQKDVEAENFNDKGYWDPFKDRHKLPNSTTNGDTLTHLLKAALGTGILAMPLAFKCAGITFGIVATILVSLVCTHCSYVLVKCAHALYHRTRVSAMSFADVGEIAFKSGPPWARKFSKLARMSIVAGSFAAYFGTCSVYTVLIAHNFKPVLEHYLQMDLNERSCIAALLIPLILLCWVPNLKKLAPFSMVANVFMGVGLLITFYYLVNDLHSVSELPHVGKLEEIPQFFSITIFAIEAIGVVMPLENAMKTPQNFIGLCGVLNQGMGGVTLIYILLGFLGYLKYGEDTQASITLNLPKNSISGQIVQVLVGLAVYCTYGLQYFVCLEIVWNAVKDRFKKNVKSGDYIVRTLLTTTTVVLAVAVPQIGPFISLIGALCFSILGLIIPVFIEFVTFWDVGFGPCNWIVWKNLFVFIFGVLALVFGSYTSIVDILKIYLPHDELMSFTLSNQTLSNGTFDSIVSNGTLLLSTGSSLLNSSVSLNDTVNV